MIACWILVRQLSAERMLGKKTPPNQATTLPLYQKHSLVKDRLSKSS
jgi:hypothetical protein